MQGKSHQHTTARGYRWVERVCRFPPLIFSLYQGFSAAHVKSHSYFIGLLNGTTSETGCFWNSTHTDNNTRLNGHSSELSCIELLTTSVYFHNRNSCISALRTEKNEFLVREVLTLILKTLSSRAQNLPKTFLLRSLTLQREESTLE